MTPPIEAQALEPSLNERDVHAPSRASHTEPNDERLSLKDKTHDASIVERFDDFLRTLVTLAYKQVHVRGQIVERIRCHRVQSTVVARSGRFFSRPSILPSTHSRAALSRRHGDPLALLLSPACDCERLRTGTAPCASTVHQKPRHPRPAAAPLAGSRTPASTRDTPDASSGVPHHL